MPSIEEVVKKLDNIPLPPDPKELSTKKKKNEDKKEAVLSASLK